MFRKKIKMGANLMKKGMQKFKGFDSKIKLIVHSRTRPNFKAKGH